MQTYTDNAPYTDQDTDIRQLDEYVSSGKYMDVSFAHLINRNVALPSYSISLSNLEKISYDFASTFLISDENGIRIGSAFDTALYFRNDVKAGRTKKNSMVQVWPLPYEQAKLLENLLKFNNGDAHKSLKRIKHLDTESVIATQLRKIKTGVPSTYKLDTDIPESPGVLILHRNDEPFHVTASANMKRQFCNLREFRMSMSGGDIIRYVRCKEHESSLLASFYQAKHGIIGNINTL